MSKMMLRLLLLSGLALGSVAVVGCADDSSEEGTEATGDNNPNRPRSDAGGNDNTEDANTSLDTGVVPEDDAGTGPGPDPEPEPDAGTDLTAACDLLGVSENLGQTCDPADEAACGTTGACLELQNTPGPLCYTICLPDLCGQTCGGTEQCVPLVSVDPATEEQTPAEVDLDGDGNPDTALGGCIEPPTGDVTDYLTCDQDNLCASGLDCIGFSPDADSICSGDCASNADCPTIEGIAGTCVTVSFESGEETQKCLLPCTSGSDAGCPPNFSCVPVQGANGLCIAN
jgi:hypothetical protein